MSTSTVKLLSWTIWVTSAWLVISHSFFFLWPDICCIFWILNWNRFLAYETFQTDCNNIAVKTKKNKIRNAIYSFTDKWNAHYAIVFIIRPLYYMVVSLRVFLQNLVSLTWTSTMKSYLLNYSVRKSIYLWNKNPLDQSHVIQTGKPYFFYQNNSLNVNFALWSLNYTFLSDFEALSML